MCLILDANFYGDFLNPKNADMAPVKEWLSRRGKLVYSPTDKLKRELTKNMKEQFKVYGEAGRLKIIDKNKVMETERTLPKLKSNDGHIIALAIASGTKLLASKDKPLQKDFINIVKGKVYENKKTKNSLLVIYALN